MRRPIAYKSIEYAEPEFVLLKDFRVEWYDFSGTCTLHLGFAEKIEDLGFNLDVTGRVTYSVPAVGIGGPASTAEFVLTKATSKAVNDALTKTFTRLKGAGRDISYHTPAAERIDAGLLREIKRKVDANYTIKMAVEKVGEEGR